MNRRRDLDQWADMLRATDDEDALKQLGHWCVMWDLLESESAKICDQLRGVDARGLAAMAADRLSVVHEGFIDARAGFLRHERGL